MKGELGAVLRGGWLAVGTYAPGNVGAPMLVPLEAVFSVGAGAVTCGLGGSKKLRFT
jgi:hypothetical protein